MHLIALAVLLLQAKPPETLPIGASAPDFDLPGVDGKRYTLKEFADAKLLCVIFNTNHCPTAQLYEDRIRRLVDEVRPKGVAVVVISPNVAAAVRLDELGYTDLDDSFASMKIRAAHRKFNYPYLYDGEPNTASQAYGPRTTPHAFLFDGERKLRYQGRIDDAEWEKYVEKRDLHEAIEALLAGREVPTPETRPFGCSIKWPSKVKSVESFLDRIRKEPVTIEAAGADRLGGLRKNDAGRVRLIHVWSPDDPSQLAAVVEMHHMYRRRNFDGVTVAVGAEEAALAALKKHPASCTNLRVAGKDELKPLLGDDWGGTLPYTLVVGADNGMLHAGAGALDVLAVRRAIVPALTDDRLERFLKRRNRK